MLIFERDVIFLEKCLRYAFKNNAVLINKVSDNKYIGFKQPHYLHLIWYLHLSGNDNK